MTVKNIPAKKYSIFFTEIQKTQQLNTFYA